MNVLDRRFTLAWSLIGFSLCLTQCGKKEYSPVPSPEPTHTVEAHVTPASQLISQGLALELNCFRLLKDRASGLLWLEITAAGCDQVDTIAKDKKIFLAVLEYVDPKRVADKTNLFYLYDHFLPVGKMVFESGGYELTELCTSDYFRASCELRVSEQGAITAMIPNSAAPTDRMMREVQLRDDNQTLADQLKQVRGVLKAAETLNEQNKKITESNKKAMTDILTSQGARITPLLAKLTLQLDGDPKAMKPGLVAQLPSKKQAVDDIQNAIEKNRKQLKELEDSKEAAEALVAEAEKKLVELIEGKAPSEKIAAQSESLAQALILRDSSIKAYETSEARKTDLGAVEQLAKAKRELGSLQTDILLKKEVAADLTVAQNQIIAATSLIASSRWDEVIKSLPGLVSKLDAALVKLKASGTKI